VISHHHRVIFVHIHKTGGSSIEAALDLEERRGRGTGGAMHGPEKHWPARTIKRRVPPEVWRDYYKFSIVRNPWARVASYWWNVHKGGPRPDFREWLLAEFARKRRPWWLRSQIEWLESPNGSFEIDFVGRFENLAADFARACGLADIAPRPLPHILRRQPRRRPHYTDVYDPETRSLIATAHAADIAEFKYQFEDEMLPEENQGDGKCM